MTTDESARPVTSAEAGEVESNPEDQIPGQESLFPGLHGDDEGAAHLLSPPSGKPPIDPGMSGPPLIALEKEPGQREYLILPENSGEFIGNPLMRRPSPYSPKEEPGVARGAVPLASMREPGFLDQPERIEKLNPIETPVFDQPLRDAATIKEAVSSKAAHADRTVASALKEEDRYRPDAEYGFRVHKGEEPKYGEAGTPLIGFTYSCLMPDGSLAEGSVQIPTDHDGLTPHGQIKNYQTLGNVIADMMTQLTVELNMRMNLARATRAAQEHECGQ